MPEHPVAPFSVTRYEIITAADAPWRDPVSWVFGQVDQANGTFGLLSVVEGAAGVGRQESMGMFWAISPP